MPRRVQLIVEYDGTDFQGWQLQLPEEKGARTVQGVLEAKLANVTGTEIRVISAGRTDAGVHAMAQSVTFDLPDECSVPTQKLPEALNSLLPPDLSIREAFDRPPDFHAQIHSCGKGYRYLLIDTRRRAALLRRTHWLVRYPLDVDAMRQAAGHLVGEHDFAAFVTRLSMIQAKREADDEEALSTVRRITGMEIDERYLSEFDLREICVLVEGTGFLYKMVRTIVGSLVEVGRGRFPPEWLGEVLRSKDRNRAGPTAPPQGLCLMKVIYPH